MLRGEDLGQVAGDPALRACRDDPVPVLSAAVSVAAATRAAECGAGILLEGMSGVDRLARVCEAFDSAGGTGSKVLIRRVWLGDVPAGLVRSSGRCTTATRAPPPHSATTRRSHRPTRPRSRRASPNWWRPAGSMRSTSGFTFRAWHPEAVRDQIEALGTEVVGPVKEIWPGHRP